MRSKLRFCFAVSVLTIGTMSAQDVAAQEDASDFLAAADQAMGAGNLHSLHISGGGWYAPLGQNFSPEEHWPRLNLQSYDLTIDYENLSSREEIVVTQGDNPSRGGGFQPIVGERRTLSFLSGDDAWGMEPGGQMSAQPDQAEVRKFLISTSPHGFIKAALESDNATVTERYFAATHRTVKVIGFTTMEKYRVTGEFDENNMLERVITWVPDPVMGDMQYEIRYTDYRDIGDGVMFPFRYHAHKGDQFLLPTNFARNWMDYRVSEAEANIDVDIPVPDGIAGAQPQPINVVATEVADGVWHMTGSNAHSVAIEFRDFITVVEAPTSDERSYAVIAEIKRLIPGKPIRYLVTTHHHFDHIGGIRNYVAEGATVVTHELNEEFFHRVVFATQSRVLNPDRLHLYPFATTGPTPLRLETMTDRHAISDGSRILMLFHLDGIDHAATMLVAYLPAEKIIIHADNYSPVPPGGPAPERIRDREIDLYRAIQHWDLEIETHVPIHGRVGSHADFERIVGPAAMQQVSNAGEGGG
jgi:glyoxylase-like metal-dependent hydrolase (beta-lactamase superfamily II)